MIPLVFVLSIVVIRDNINKEFVTRVNNNMIGICYKRVPNRNVFYIWIDVRGINSLNEIEIWE